MADVGAKGGRRGRRHRDTDTVHRGLSRHRTHYIKTPTAEEIRYHYQLSLSVQLYTLFTIGY